MDEPTEVMAYHAHLDECAQCENNEDQESDEFKQLDIVFWGSPGDERLSNTELDEAIESILDDCHPDHPETVEVAGFQRMQISLDSGCLLERVIAHFDEELGDPQGDPHEPSDLLKEAAEKFAEAFRKEYTPWACDQVVLVTVNDVSGWVKKNWPDDV